MHAGERETFSVAGHVIQVHHARTTVVIDQHLVPCSPAQYALLVLLLQHTDRCVPYRRLLACLHEVLPDQPTAVAQARNRLQHHISDLRVLLWSSGMDIACVIGVGYLLRSTLDEEQIVSGTTPPSQQR